MTFETISPSDLEDEVKKNKSQSKMEDNFGGRKDNRKDNFPMYVSGKEAQVLPLLISTNSLDGLTKETKRDKSNLHKTLKKLIAKGLVDRRDRLYFLTSYGLTIQDNLKLSSPLGGSPNTTTTLGQLSPRERIQANKCDLVRFHNIGWMVNFWKVPEQWEEKRRTFYDLPGFRFIEEFRGGGEAIVDDGDLVIGCFTTGVTVWLPEVIDSDESTATLRAYQHLKEVLPKVEARLGIGHEVLYRQGRLNVKLSSSHWAQMEHWLARYVGRESREKLAVPCDDGRIALLIDHSDTFELEAILPDRGVQDLSEAKKWLNQVIEKKGDLPAVAKARTEALEVGIGHVGALLERLSPVMEQQVTIGQQQIMSGELYSANIVKHMSVLDEMKVTLIQIREAISEAFPKRRPGLLRRLFGGGRVVLSSLVGWLW